MAKILIVEDEQTLCETLALNLSQQGHVTLMAGDGQTAVDLARTEAPELIVLDLMLPVLDGLSVCRIIRKESNVPIIMVTARGLEMDRIAGLETGADDYIVKPFSLGEFLARVKAVLRRVPVERNPVVEAGDLRLDAAARRVWLRGEELGLAPREYDLLAALLRNAGTVLSRDLLLSQVWGYDYHGDSRTVDVHIRWLREKIERDPSMPEHIVTVRGIGYRFES
jgi:DNA-binding response OmpR family regulator